MSVGDEGLDVCSSDQFLTELDFVPIGTLSASPSAAVPRAVGDLCCHRFDEASPGILRTTLLRKLCLGYSGGLSCFYDGSNFWHACSVTAKLCRHVVSCGGQLRRLR